MSAVAAGRLPDAPPDNWVDRFAPTNLRPWLKLGRFDRPIGIWLLMLPGWQGAALAAAERDELPDWRLLLLIAMGAAAMRAAGCAYNDIVDRDIDAKVARTAKRPIPAGQITVKQAWAYIVALSLVGLLILLSLNPAAFGLGLLSLSLVAAYPFMKRITWWPQAWLGLTFNWGALLGYAAATSTVPTIAALFGLVGLVTGEMYSVGAPHLGHLAAPALLLYVSGVFWTLGYDTIYAVQDMEDDALVGVKSSARRLGARAPDAVLAFYALSFALVLAMAFSGSLGALFLPVSAVLLLHLTWQAVSLRMNEPARALMLFKSNREAGLVLLFAIVAGAASQARAPLPNPFG